MRLKYNPYYYFFYKINHWITKRNKQYDETNGFIIVCTLLGFQLGHINAICLLLIDKRLFYEMRNINQLYIYIYAALFLFINHLLLIRKGKHLIIMEYYKNESRRQSIIGNIAVVLLVIFTFCTIFVWTPIDYLK